MAKVLEEPAPSMPEQLEQAFEEAREIGLEVALRGGTGGPLNTFLGTDELRIMGGHLLEHMKDEERWGEPNKNFEPIDFVVAAHEVAHDHTAGKADTANVHVHERQPTKITLDIFINFWLPRISDFAYGDKYGNQVRSIVENTR